MRDWMILIIFLFSVLLSWQLTSLVRRYALSKNLLDLPNARSSHSVPTPRGGGLAVIIVLLSSVILTLFYPDASVPVLVSLFLVTAAFAFLGWQDDKHDLSATLRFFLQLFIAAVFIVTMAWFGLLVFTLSIVGGISMLLSVLWIVWMANLYNFMDGIDGISAIESIMLGVVTSFWFALSGVDSLAIISIAVAGGALGFLYWNWSPAKIFMGDVGSLALGAFFAILALIGSSIFEIPFSAFIILYAVYLADAGVTLLHRMIKREQWWQAHRSHYYQRAVQSGYSHAQVSLGVMMINLLLAGLATLVVFEALDASIALLISSIILAPLMFLINLRFNRICQK